VGRGEWGKKKGAVRGEPGGGGGDAYFEEQLGESIPYLQSLEGRFTFSTYREERDGKVGGQASGKSWEVGLKLDGSVNYAGSDGRESWNTSVIYKVPWGGWVCLVSARKSQEKKKKNRRKGKEV